LDKAVEPDIEEALARFANDQGLSRDEALALIVRDWLVGNEYLLAVVGDEEGQSA